MKTVLIQEEQQNPTQEIWISDVNLVIVTATKLQPTQYEFAYCWRFVWLRGRVICYEYYDWYAMLWRLWLIYVMLSLVICWSVNLSEQLVLIDFRNGYKPQVQIDGFRFCRNLLSPSCAQEIIWDLWFTYNLFPLPCLPTTLGVLLFKSKNRDT